MSSFESFINVIALLTVLSVISERFVNWLKLRNDDLSIRKDNPIEERKRETKIQTRSFYAGIVLAVLVKADIFNILAHMDDPWSTLGWIRVTGGQWFQSPALSDFGTFAYAVVGCVFTGVGLGFGSKFWHDILGGVFELRDKVRRGRMQAQQNPGGESGDQNSGNEDGKNPPVEPNKKPGTATTGG